MTVSIWRRPWRVWPWLAFHVEDRFHCRFDASNQRFFKLMRRSSASTSHSGFETFIDAGGMVVRGQVCEGEGGLTGDWPVIWWCFRIIPPARSISDGWFRIRRGPWIDWTRYWTLRKRPERRNCRGPTAGVEIRFENINAYGAEPVLKEVSFEVKKGETVALVGPSGSVRRP